VRITLPRYKTEVLTIYHSAAIILFLVLLFQFVADLPNHPDQSPTVKGQHFVDILIVAVTVIVVAVPGK
jgi:Ca2+-transporting ATPase